MEDNKSFLLVSSPEGIKLLINVFYDKIRTGIDLTPGQIRKVRKIRNEMMIFAGLKKGVE